MRTKATSLLSVATLGIGACGTGDGDRHLSRTELTTRVNAICREIQRLSTESKPAGRTGREEIQAFFDRTLPRARQQVDRLPPPSRAPEGIADDYSRFVELRQAELAALKDVRDTVDDLAQATAAAQAVDRLRNESAELTKKLRLVDCRR